MNVEIGGSPEVREGPNLTEVRMFLVNDLMPVVGQDLRIQFQRHLRARDERRLMRGIIEDLKNPNSPEPTSKVDKSIDLTIQKALLQRFPNIRYLSEDSVNGPDRDGRLWSLDPDYLRTVEWMWVVDSIDGSGRMLDYSTRFSSSIALVHFGQPMVGVVHAPEEKESPTFWAQDDMDGAYRNGKRMFITDIDSAKKATISTAFAWDDDKRRRTLEKLVRFGIDVRQFTGTASSVLDIAEVGEGTLSGHMSGGLKPHDVAAATLLGTKGGAVASTWEKKPWDVFQDSLVLMVPGIDNEMHDLIRDADAAIAEEDQLLKFAREYQGRRILALPRFLNTDYGQIMRARLGQIDFWWGRKDDKN